MPVRYMAISKVGGSQGLTKKAEELTMIFISCLLRYSGNLISSQFSYFTSWKNGKQFDCCCCQAALIHFDRQGKKTKTNNLPPSQYSQTAWTLIHLTAQSPPAAQNSHLLPSTLATQSHHVPTTCLWLHFTSATKISLRSQVQIAFPSLVAALPLYRDFLNQIKIKIKSLCAQTRAALLYFAGKTPSEKQPALKDFKTLKPVSGEKLLWKPTQATVINKHGAESMKHKKQPCRNATWLAKQCPDAEHLVAWYSACTFISKLRGRQRRL